MKKILTRLRNHRILKKKNTDIWVGMNLVVKRPKLWSISSKDFYKENM